MFAIAAVSQSWGIGKDNRLLFHISADMKRFRALTLDKTVLMGRRTLDSMPGGKGLPHRRNIVLTSNPAYTAQGAETVLNPVQALFTAGEDAAVIGGDEDYDIAVIKVEGTNFQPVVIGKSGNLGVKPQFPPFRDKHGTGFPMFQRFRILLKPDSDRSDKSASGYNDSVCHELSFPVETKTRSV